MDSSAFVALDVVTRDGVKGADMDSLIVDAMVAPRML